MKSWVIDASVAIKLRVEEEGRAKVCALVSALGTRVRLHVPDLFFVEVGNILWKRVRRGDQTKAEANVDMEIFGALPLQVTSTHTLVADALEFAVARDVTAYDACYVVLAERHGIGLLTADERLARKLEGSGREVTLLVSASEANLLGG